MCVPEEKKKKGATAITKKYTSYVLCEVIVHCWCPVTCAAVWSTLACLLVGLGLGWWGWVPHRSAPPLLLPPPTGSILPLHLLIITYHHPSPSLPLLTLAPLLRTLQHVVYPLPTALGQGGWSLLLKDRLLMDDIIDSR